MKKAGLIMAVATALLTGCASTSPYLIDRSRDAADIFTLTTGKGHGAKARVGPIHGGLFFNRDNKGLRGGEAHTDWVHEDSLPRTFDFELTFVSGERFDPDTFERARERHKCFAASGLLGASWSRGFDEEGWSVGDFSYYTQAEMGIGLFRTVRVGFNIGEVLDFLIGWTTLDLFNDDIEKRRASVEEPQPEQPETE